MSTGPGVRVESSRVRPGGWRVTFAEALGQEVPGVGVGSECLEAQETT